MPGFFMNCERSNLYGGDSLPDRLHHGRRLVAEHAGEQALKGAGQGTAAQNAVTSGSWPSRVYMSVWQRALEMT
jgi:hypothetical protein